MVQLYLECICVLLRYTVCAIFHYSCESGKATHFKHALFNCTLFNCMYIGYLNVVLILELRINCSF